MSTRPKIAVFSIAKDEELNVAGWAEHVHEADAAFVLDTGSSDDTVQRLVEAGVTAAIWRQQSLRFDFSEARNHVLKAGPAWVDYALWIDMDERLPKGWRAQFDHAHGWHPGAPMFSVTRVWGALRYERAVLHTRRSWHWERPVHEYLVWGDRSVHSQPSMIPTGIEVEHLQDPYKDRSQYLDLMGIGTRRDPQDQQLAFWYARELMYAGRDTEAFAEFERFLQLPGTWDVERMQAFLHLGEMFTAQRDQSMALASYASAQSAAPHRREPTLALARTYQRVAGDYETAKKLAEHALTITDRPHDYLSSDETWDDELIKKEFDLD